MRRAFSDETVVKLRRVRAALKAQGVPGMVFSTRANFAWLTGGGDNHVVSQSEHGAASIVVTPRRALLVANRIEMRRIVEEEPVAGFTPVETPWDRPKSFPDFV